jgi:pimeloyl-ACP methyl ester carboxylesterase
MFQRALAFIPLALLAQPTAREGHTPAGTAQIWFTDTGGAGVPVILLHAATGSSRVWEHQTAAFQAAGFRVIAYDRRGYGRSTGPVEGTAADDLEALAGHLGLTRFHLVGTAAGGGVAVDYVLSFPRRVRGLVLANSLGGVTEPDFRALLARLMPDGFTRMPASFRELGPSYRAGDPEGTGRWEALEKESRPPGARESQRQTRNRITFAALEAITAPVLLLTGGADLYMPPPLLRRFAERLNSRTVIVPEAGHSAYWENPGEFNRAVVSFLKRH